MNQDDLVKKQLQGMGVAFAVLLIFGESFLLGSMPKDVVATTRKIATLQDEKRSFEQLKATVNSLEIELEESRISYERLYEKFPSDEYTQNRINQVITDMTASVIVISDKLNPVKKFDYVSADDLVASVPKVGAQDPELRTDRTVGVAVYESEIQMRCNYFELLEFLHATANQSIFLTPLDLEISPDPDAPYGVNVKTKLMTFGFEGIKPDKF